MYKIVKYLLEDSAENSRTWLVHFIYLSKKYELDDPSECLKLDPPSKSEYKELVRTKICAHYERNLRELAENNSQMT